MEKYFATFGKKYLQKTVQDSQERSKAFLVFLASGHLLYGYKKSPHRFIP
jgi:hypothetical protein